MLTLLKITRRFHIPLTTLQRTVRFAINPTSASADNAWSNGKGGVPAVVGLGRWFEFSVECAGEPDLATGYLVDIRTIDRAVRNDVAPIIARACAETPDAEPGEIMPEIVATVSSAIPSVRAVVWHVTPYYWVRMTTGNTYKVRIAQRFEFAAAHRLHSPALTDEQNRAAYGRCNNPAGHGHNYQVEPVVEVALDPDSAQPFTLTDLERCTGKTIIDRFDHKHLNTDVPEFAGLIPSVEMIAKIAFDLLAPEIERESRGAARLVRITIWETEKTSATYSA